MTGPRMTPEQLDQIQARAERTAAFPFADKISREDVPALLVLVREQQAKLDEYEAKYGEHTTDNQGRGCPACAAHIRVKARERAALTATEGAE